MALRTLHCLACVLEALHDALNQLSAAAPAWVQPHVPLDWYPRDGLRSDQARLPKDTSTREALARQVGAAGSQRLAWVPTTDTALGRSDLLALEARRRMWLQQYDRCPIPGLEPLRWRTRDEPPPQPCASPRPMTSRRAPVVNARRTGWAIRCISRRPVMWASLI